MMSFRYPLDAVVETLKGELVTILGTTERGNYAVMPWDDERQVWNAAEAFELSPLQVARVAQNPTRKD